jgi:hypothetical protein
MLLSLVDIHILSKLAIAWHLIHWDVNYFLKINTAIKGKIFSHYPPCLNSAECNMYCIKVEFFFVILCYITLGLGRMLTVDIDYQGSFEEMVDMNEACGLLAADEPVAARTRLVTVNSEVANVATHEPPRMVVVENRPQVVEPHAVQQVKAASVSDPPSTHQRPVWFLGSEEETLQVSQCGPRMAVTTVHPVSYICIFLCSFQRYNCHVYLQ